MRVCTLIVVVLISGSHVRFAHSQAISESVAKERAIQFVRDRMGLGARHFLRATRREEMDDVLFRFKQKRLGEIRKTAWFIEVTETGYEIISPDVPPVLHRGANTLTRHWLVAIDPSVGTVWGLGGIFGDSATISSFNDLALLNTTRIESDRDVKEWAWLFIRATLLVNADRMFFSHREFDRMIEDAFLAYAKSRNDELSVADWNDGLRKKEIAVNPGISVEVLSDHFEVRTHTITPSRKTGAILERILFNVVPNGSISRLTRDAIHGEE